MTRLTNLIRGQSRQETVSPAGSNSDSSGEPTGLPPPSPSVPSVSTPEVNWYRRVSHELHGIKRAVQAKQSWAVDELVRVASGFGAPTCRPRRQCDRLPSTLSLRTASARVFDCTDSAPFLTGRASDFLCNSLLYRWPDTGFQVETGHRVLPMDGQPTFVAACETPWSEVRL